MAQEYLLAKNKNQLGQIALSKSVFETIAKIAVEEEEQLALADGAFRSALTCKITDDQLIITLDVKVKYLANVEEICARLQAKIYDSISHMSDYSPDVIDIRIVGFLFE